VFVPEFSHFFQCNGLGYTASFIFVHFE
jgi:hypothetical protein